MKTLRHSPLWLCLFGATCLAHMLPVASWGQEKPDAAAVRDFNTNGALQNNGLYAKAADKWAEFIAKYPKDDRLDLVHYYLGICQFHTKKFSEAAKTFETTLQKYPKFKNIDGVHYNLGMARFQLAAASGKAEDFKAASAAFDTVAEKFPDSPHAAKSLYFKGETLYSSGDANGSVQAYQQLVTKYPQSTLAADASYYLGVTQQELEKFADAATTYANFLKNPAYANHELATEIRLRLAIALYEQEKFSEAESHFAEVAKVKDYEMADFAVLRQGQCLLEQGKTGDAAKLFTALPKDFPKSKYLTAARLAAGKCCYQTNELDEAEKLLSEAIKDQGIKPEEAAEASYWLGRTFLKQGKPQDALKVLEPAAQKYTEGEFAPYLQIARADALYDVPDRRKDSVALFEQFLQQHPDHMLAAQARYMAALSALGEKNYETSKKHAEAFLGNTAYAEHEVKPAVLFIAGESYLLGREDDDKSSLAKAEALYRQLVDNFSEHDHAPRSLLRIGWCLLETDKHDEAVKYLTGNLPALKQDTHQAEAQLLIGRGHSQLKQHEQALAAYAASLKAKGDWQRGDEVLLAAAQSHRALDNNDEAKKQLSQLISKFEESPLRARATYQLGEIAQEEQNFDQAIAHYNEVLQKYGDTQWAQPAGYGLAASHFAKDEFDKSLPQLDKLLAAEVDDELRSRGTYLRGLVHQRLQQFDPAAKDLTAFLAGKPPADDALAARFALALCQLGLEKRDEAVAVLQQILAEKPDYQHADKVHYELGHALLASEKRKEATDAFQALATKFPESTFAGEAWFHVGRQSEELADGTEEEEQKGPLLAKAADAFAAGLKTAKNEELREKLQYKLGDMQFRQENYPEAAATLLAQIKSHPQGLLLGPAQFLAGESLFRQEKYNEAMPLYVQVADAKVEKYHAQALYRAGDCAGYLKDWGNSQKHFDALIKQFPKFEQLNDARYGLAYALHNQNQLDEAEKLFVQVTADSETETAAKARFMIGEIAFARKKYEDAVEHFLAVAVGYPYKQWQAMARFETGRCFMELGQKEKAINTFETMLQKHPDHERAPDATKFLAELRK